MTDWLKLGKMKLVTGIALVILAIVFASLLSVNLLMSRYVTNNMIKMNGDHFLDIAYMVSVSPIVTEGLQGKRTDLEIQSFANEVTNKTGLSYVVVADMDNIRKSHPDVTKIGQKGETEYGEAAYQGHAFYKIDKGALGYSLKAFYPIYSSEGNQIGIVAVGMILDDVEKTISEMTKMFYYMSVFGLLIGIAGAIALSRSVKKKLFGLEPVDIARILEERSAMLHSVRDGIIAANNQGIITVVNKQAERLLRKAGISKPVKGEQLVEFFPQLSPSKVLAGTPQYDMGWQINSLDIYANTMPLSVKGNIFGVLVTFRDKEEIYLQAEELTGVRNYIEALRSQIHEFMNELHVMLGLLEYKRYDQLEKYIRTFTHKKESILEYVNEKVKDPLIAAFLLSKFSRSRELNVAFYLSDNSCVGCSLNDDTVHDLVTILGNLIENAFDAVATTQTKEVVVSLKYVDDLLTIIVRDTGHGISEEARSRIFDYGFTTKYDERGVGLYLVKKVIAKLHGTIRFETSAGVGTSFEVTLPCAPKEAESDD
ncbi:MAG: DcuS/MalK family sensor histidine kinase [Negativicutes bacterium]